MFVWLEKNPFFFAVAVFIIITYAGIVEVLPNFTDNTRLFEDRKPYTVLELAGRQIYIRDSCNAYHSQLIRPFKPETDRYGMYSVSGEFAYDRPFLWGSERTGPNLTRIGNCRTADWHENHMLDPTSIVPGSIMPAYKYVFSSNTDIETAYAEALTVKKVFSVPYDVGEQTRLGTWEEAREEVKAQAAEVVEQMKGRGVKDAFAGGEIGEIVALIAYLNSLK